MAKPESIATVGGATHQDDRAECQISEAQKTPVMPRYNISVLLPKIVNVNKLKPIESFLYFRVNRYCGKFAEE